MPPEERTPPPPYHWIADEAASAELCDRLLRRHVPWGIDIENTLTGQHHCKVVLCQLSDGHEAWLVDPLAVDLSPVLAALYSGKPPVLVHDGSGDFTILKRVYGLMPERTVDTLLAAQQIGFPTPNLRDLSREYLGIRLSKRAQHSNWHARPLSREQLDYASFDAWVLPSLAVGLLRDVEAAGKQEALQAAIAALLKTVQAYRIPDRNPAAASFAHQCRDQAARVRLDCLLEWRTREGNRGNVEVLMSVSNKILMLIARANPVTSEDLRRIVRFPPRVFQRHTHAILECCERGTASAGHRTKPAARPPAPSCQGEPTPEVSS